MAEKRCEVKVTTYRVTYACPDCRQDMEYTGGDRDVDAYGYVTSTNYSHRCTGDNCWYSTWLDKKYPTIEHDYEEITDGPG